MEGLGFEEADWAEWLTLWEETRQVGAVPPAAVTAEVTGVPQSDTLIAKSRVGMMLKRLLGNMPGFGYKARQSETGRDWFRSLVTYGGGRPLVSHDTKGVVARLSDHEDERFLWVVNRLPETRTVTLDLSESGLTALVYAKRGGGRRLRKDRPSS